MTKTKYYEMGWVREGKGKGLKCAQDVYTFRKQKTLAMIPTEQTGLYYHAPVSICSAQYREL